MIPLCRCGSLDCLLGAIFDTSSSRLHQRPGNESEDEIIAAQMHLLAQLSSDAISQTDLRYIKENSSTWANRQDKTNPCAESWGELIKRLESFQAKSCGVLLLEARETFLKWLWEAELSCWGALLDQGDFTQTRLQG